MNNEYHESALATGNLTRSFMPRRERYWTNRDVLLNKYPYKIVVIEDAQILAIFSSLYEAKLYRDTLRPWCFMTVVGDEEGGKPLVIQEQTHVYVETELLPTFDARVPTEEFKQRYMFEGPARRPFVTLPVRALEEEKEVLPVWFFVDTGSAISFLESTTCQALFGNKVNPPEEFIVYINQHPLKVSRSNEAFSGINLLGRDYLSHCDLHLSARNTEINLEE